MPKRKRKIKLNVYEERILRIMRRYYDLMNINEISEESGIHWKTAKKYLHRLRTKGLVKMVRRIEEGKKSILWKAKEIEFREP